MGDYIPNKTEKNGLWEIRITDQNDIEKHLVQRLDKDEINKAIEDVYSQQGIEYKKRLMMDGIDL